jgi:putative ABC transport system permease protein
VVAAAILGIVTPVAAALGPGRRAARVDPVDALRGSQPEAARDSGWWLLGAAMLGVMIASVLLAPTWQVADRFMRVAGGPLMIAGAILLVPKAMPLVATRLRPLVGRLAPGVGEIAMHHVTRERNRSANTSGIMMVVVAMVLTFGAMAGSWRPIVVEQVERQFGADVVITTADGETDLADLATTVEASGVATAMTTLQQGDAQLLAPDLRAVPVVAVDGATYFRVSGYPWSSPETTDEGVARALAGGGAVILPELLRSELGFELGEAVTVATAAGPRRLTLAGSYLTFGTGDTTSMVVDRADASALGLDTITSVAVDVPNGDTGPLDAVLADRGEILEVRSTVEQQAQVMDRLDGVLALVLMVVVVSLLVGALAIASTMTVSVLARVRELGILRSVGARRREVQAMVVAEAAVLAVVAVVLGTLLGAFVGWVMVNGLGEDFANPVPYTFPWAWLGVATVIALTTAALASVVPGRRATSIDPVTALAHE